MVTYWALLMQRRRGAICEQFICWYIKNLSLKRCGILLRRRRKTNQCHVAARYTNYSASVYIFVTVGSQKTSIANTSKKYLLFPTQPVSYGNIYMWLWPCDYFKACGGVLLLSSRNSWSRICLEISMVGGTKISKQVISKLDETSVRKEEWKDTTEEGKYVKQACRNVQQSRQIYC